MDIGQLNDLLDAFDAATSHWSEVITPMALGLFFLLATIEWGWTFLTFALSSRASGWDLLPLVFRKILYFGFVLWLLRSSAALLPLIIAGFQRAGGAAGGITALRPSSFLNTGSALAMHILSSMDAVGMLLDPIGRSVALLGALFSLAAFAVMAAGLTLILIETFILIAAACPFLLALAASRWTFSIAEAALAAVIRAGVKLFATYLVASVVASVTFLWADRLLQQPFLGILQYFTFLGSLATATILLFTLPSRLSSYLVPAGIRLGLNPLADA